MANQLHSAITGIDLHQPFAIGNDADKAASPAVGDAYYASDTYKLYYCHVAGSWAEFPNRRYPVLTNVQNTSDANTAITTPRIEVGCKRITYSSTSTLLATVTFSSAFAVFLAGVATLSAGSGFDTYEPNMVLVDSGATTGMRILLRDEGTTFVAGNTADLYWIAIGHD